nr:DUF308 domain-containing protein [uncultured Cetobacterium sp.]
MKNNLKSFFLSIGIIYVVIGALGISNINFFAENIKFIISCILFINGIYHLFYSASKRKDPYFHWGLVFGEGILELISLFIILFNTFTSKLFFTSYIGGLLCLKGLILLLSRGNKITSWENIKNIKKAIVILKGLLHFLFGSLIIILPVIGSPAVNAVFGWYILFLGIHYITHE